MAFQVDDGVPLFFSMLDNDGDGRADQMCLSSRYESPFVAEASDSPLNLTYYLCYDEDVLKVGALSYVQVVINGFYINRITNTLNRKVAINILFFVFAKKKLNVNVMSEIQSFLMMLILFF